MRETNHGAAAFALVFVLGCGRTELWTNGSVPTSEDDASTPVDVADATPDDVSSDVFDTNADVSTIVEIEIPIAAGNDDALQDPDGTMLVDYSWISLYSPLHRGALRFVLGLPRDARLLEAHVEVYVDSDTEASPDDAIRLEDRRDPKPFTTKRNDIGSRALTTAFVPWIASGVGRGRVRSPSLVDLLAPVIASPSYAPGNAVVLVFVPRSDVGSGRVFEFRQYESGAEFAARLIVRFQPP